MTPAGTTSRAVAGSNPRNRASKSSASEPPAAAETTVWQRALRLLAARERSTAELAARLHRAGGSDVAVAAALERLRALGYLDDARVAQHAAAQTARRGRGSIYARAHLAARGVDRALIDTAIRDQFTDEAALAGSCPGAPLRDPAAVAGRPRACWPLPAATWLPAGHRPRHSRGRLLTDSPHDRSRNSLVFPGVFPCPRPRAGAQFVARAGEGSDPAVHQRRHGAVQGRLPRPRDARQSARGRRQKCLRLSGKHNDLEEVGRDTYHHTLFEMLGNWSFGDYYKREAIAWAWELLTRVWKLPKDRLCATVYTTDDEAEHALAQRNGHRPGPHPALRREGQLLGDGRDRAVRSVLGDPHRPRRRQPATASTSPATSARSTPAARATSSCGTWSSSSTTARQPGCSRTAAKHVDTGMGLERVAAVLQDVPSQLRHRPACAASSASRRSTPASATAHDAKDDLAFRVIADHSRALSFMIADGVVPGNEGRGYVLRRLLRRAARHGSGLGFTEPFLWRVTEAVADTMGDAYPELLERRAHIEAVIRTRGGALRGDPRQGPRPARRGASHACATTAPRGCRARSRSGSTTPSASRST